MKNEVWVKLALKTFSCSQKELAIRLGVSPTQITKWKNEEHMSFEMEKKFREILNMSHQDPEFVLWAGSLQDANKWEELIYFLAETAIDNAETGYDTDPLHDEPGILCWHTFYVLREMGVDLPKKFPDELEFNYDNIFDDEERVILLLEENPYSSHIYKIYTSLNDVWGFYDAYISELMDYEAQMDTPAENIESGLLELAACKIKVDEKLALKFMEFRQKVMNDYEEWINLVKDSAFRAGIPLRAEIMEIVYDSHDELGQGAEAESLGYNASRLHPDIYMNELLTGMRVIHQILPAIMKKLGIFDEFVLDESELENRKYRFQSYR